MADAEIPQGGRPPGTESLDEPIRDPAVMQRMAAMADLFESALLMIRQNVLRRNPQASEEEINTAIRAWLARCPGAEHGDGEGRPRIHLE